MADLAAGFAVFLEFAEECGAIDHDEAERFWEAVWDGLMEAAAAIRSDLGRSDLCAMYLGTLAALLASGQVYLEDAADANSITAEEQERRGWRSTEGEAWEPNPGSLPVGWLAGELVYLDPDESYRAVSRCTHSSGGRLESQRTLFRILRDAGKLAELPSPGKDRKQRFACRKTIRGERQKVLVIRAGDLWGEDRAQEGAGKGGR